MDAASIVVLLKALMESKQKESILAVPSLDNEIYLDDFAVD